MIKSLNENSEPASFMVLDITSLQVNSISKKYGILRKCTLSLGKSGEYLTYNIQDVCGRVITGYYFKDDSSLLYKNWKEYAGMVCAISYEVSEVYGKLSLRIDNLKVLTKEESTVVIKSVFKLTDKNHLKAQEYILKTISSREEISKKILTALVNSSTGSSFINGMNADLLNGKIGGNSIFTEYIFKQILEIPESLNITDAQKDEMLTVYLMCESAIYAEKCNDSGSVLLLNIMKTVNKFNNTFKQSTGKEISKITINGYLGNRFAYNADSNMESIILTNIYKAAFTIFNVETELSRVGSIGMVEYDKTNIFKMG